MDADRPAPSPAFVAIYDELRSLARARLERGLAGSSLQATALVHEVWLKLAGAEDVPDDPRHFYATAAQAMRWILVDHARRKGAAKRAVVREERDPDELPAATVDADAPEILALDEALERLGARDPRKAEVVLLRHFAGLSVEDTAQALELSPATVKREWQFARAWLVAELSGREESADS